MIPHSKPLLGDDEAEAAARVIRSGMLAQGAECERLERELEAYLSVGHAVVVSSGSAALHLALLAAGLGAQHRVAIPSYVCSALLNAVKHTGATPVLIDLPETGYNVSVADVDADAAIVPHMFGVAADLTQLNLPVIEDCAMAIGASSDGRKLGTIGQLGIFSFYATKVLCAGEGGAVCTGDQGLAEAIRDLRDYDGRNDSRRRYNYKMTDLQASVARVQLARLDAFIERRRELAAEYNRRLAGSPLTLPTFGDEDIPFRYVLEHTDMEATRWIDALEGAGIAARHPVYAPLHRLDGQDDAEYPYTTRAQQKAVSIPLYPALTDEDVETVVRAVESTR